MVLIGEGDGVEEVGNLEIFFRYGWKSLCCGFGEINSLVFRFGFEVGEGRGVRVGRGDMFYLVCFLGWRGIDGFVRCIGKGVFKYLLF